MTSRTPFCVLTIAGTDPSGGAGIQADIKTISASGCYAASVITALTAQNTQGVQAVQEVPPDFIRRQLDSVFNDLTVHAVKIGMLHNKAVIQTVASALKDYCPEFIVIDPVMIAKNGCPLLQDGTIALLKETLFPLATVITPNALEAEKISGQSIETPADLEAAAIEMGQQFKTNVLAKGGHLAGPRSSDVLYLADLDECRWFHAEQIVTPHTHGTGCTFSSAIASWLARGHALPDAINIAKHYLTQAIKTGSTQQIGRGRGPVDHFYHWR